MSIEKCERDLVDAIADFQAMVSSAKARKREPSESERQRATERLERARKALKEAYKAI